MASAGVGAIRSKALAFASAVTFCCALTACASPDDIHSATDLASYMENRASLSCADSAGTDAAGAQLVICFSQLQASQVRLEYFEDAEVGDAVEELLADRWTTRRGDRWVVATDGSVEGQSILDRTP